MAQATAIRLTGEDLRIDDVWSVAFGTAEAALSDEARTKMRAARELVERAAHGTREHTYGINTGFGRFVSQSIPEEQTEELQLRLLRSHACGVGEPYPAEIIRAAMLLRANALAKGTSGARIETVELLLECLDRGVLPYVPSRGSVGASGDLAPLAHLALPLVGEGDAWFGGELMSGANALTAAGLEPTRLAAKDGLSLINGTQFMAAFGALGVSRGGPTSPARCRSRRCRGRARASSRKSTGCVRCAGRRILRRTFSACSKDRRSTRRTSGATRCRMRTPCVAHRRCTAPPATC